MNQRKQAWLIIAASLSFLGFILGAKVLISTPPVCDPSIKSKTVILIDHSEAVAKQTIDAIVERAWQMIEETVPEGEMISIFTLSKVSKREFAPSFSACKPRKEGSRSIEDVRRIKRDFEEKFKKPLRRELAAPISGGNSEESPVAQAIIDLSLDDKHFRSPDVTRLVIFSDFLEYTPKFSLYDCKDPANVIEKFRASRLGAVERPTFKHVDIRMNIVPRYNVSKVALQCRDKFWPWFFGDNQGTCKRDSCLTPDFLPG